MNNYKAQPAKSLGFRLRSFFDHSAVFWGCLVAIAVVAIGRTFIEVSVSTLSGWTALFLLALFLGLVVANASRNHAFAFGLQRVSFILGALVSLGAIVFLAFELDAPAEALLVIAAILLIASLSRAQWHKPPQDTFQDTHLARWALRLDDLLKYELPLNIRGDITRVIDKLWQAPQDTSDFIPVQNQRIDELLDEIEFSTKENSGYKLEETLSELLLTLEERNQLIHKNVQIEYQNVSKNSRLLSPPSKNTRPSQLE